MMTGKGIVTATGTREWSAHSANLYLGCGNNCKYCFARAQAIHYGRIKTREEWWRMAYRPTAFTQESARRKVEGVIMFPTTHDIFPHNLAYCLSFLRNTLQQGNKVLIVSKPRYDCVAMLCNHLALYKQQILFRFTIGSRHNDVLKFWEPQAPRYEERLACLTEALKQGYETSVSIEPMLDQDMEQLYWAVEPFVTNAVWFGMMNRIHERVDTRGWNEKDLAYLEEVNKTCEEGYIRQLYDVLGSHSNVRWKDGIKQILGLPLSQKPGLDQ